MKVAILDDYLDTLRTLPCFALLEGHEVTVLTEHLEDPVELAARLDGVEALVLIRERTRVTDELLALLPRLRLISLRSAYPHVDVDACTRRGVLVCSELHPGTPSVAAAELTWALVLAASRRIPQQVASMRSGRWQESIGRSLRGRTLGVYGYGRIGQVVAGYGAAFEMEVLVLSGPASQRRARADGHQITNSRERFFERADVLSVHLRLNDKTRGVITAADLARMQPDSLFVNTSRAGLVAPGALLGALRAGRPGGAALDVYDHEPVTDVDDPLLSMDNVICTPHIGYVTREEWDLQFHDVFTQVRAFASGAPINVVNDEVLA